MVRIPLAEEDFLKFERDVGKDVGEKSLGTAAWRLKRIASIVASDWWVTWKDGFAVFNIGFSGQDVNHLGMAVDNSEMGHSIIEPVKRNSACWQGTRHRYPFQNFLKSGVVPESAITPPSKPEDLTAVTAYINRGNAWNSKGEYDRAIAEYDQALRLKPDFAAVYNDRAYAWYHKGEYDKAFADYTTALELDPAHSDWWSERAICCRMRGDYGRAMLDLNQAVRIGRTNAAAYNGLAWFQATCPDSRYRDGAGALVNARKCYELDGRKHWTYLDTLAAAYAEKGDFAKAREWELKTIALLEKEKTASEEVKQELRSRLELYKQNKPYRQESSRRKSSREE